MQSKFHNLKDVFSSFYVSLWTDLWTLKLSCVKMK